MEETLESPSNAPNCQHCQDRMVVEEVRKHPGSWPKVLCGLGLLFSMFMVGPIVGIPMLLIGIYMYQAKETICLCPSCGYHYQVFTNPE
jgi:hypothetical protein